MTPSSSPATARGGSDGPTSLRRSRPSVVFVLLVLEFLVVFVEVVVLVLFIDVGRVQSRQMVRVRGDLLPFRRRVELRPRLLVSEMDGEHAALEELEAVVVSEVLRLVPAR